MGDNSSESYGGSQAELEVAANRLFTSPPRPQPLSFEALSLQTPARTVPPTPGTALQQKVQANLEKSLSSRFDIQMDQVRGPSSMLPLNSVIKDAFNKFDQDFQVAYLPEGKYIKPPPSTAKWYKVGQPCFEDKIQELNTDFAKICISPKPSGAPKGKVPMPILKELEHQARQNISTLNFATTFAKTSSSCNATLERCQHSLKATSKKVKSQIRKGANPEKAAKRGYEEACEYLDLWNKTVLIQHGHKLPW